MKAGVKKFLPLIEFARCADTPTTEIADGKCYACGGVSQFRYVEVINDALAKEWRLSSKEQRAMSARESMYCAFCGCSQRLRNLALAVTLGLPRKLDEPQSLYEAIQAEAFAGTSTAEINSCGALHDILKGLPELHYSEYGSTHSNIKHEDLMALTYKDNSFDLVLTSDTLEHVPDAEKALTEIFRILKPGGKHIFTVPAFLDRDSYMRVAYKDGKPEYQAEKSYHGSGEPDYLVWNEFGSDFVDIIQKAGFAVQLYFTNLADLGDPSYIFVAQKPDGELAKTSAIRIDPTVQPTKNPKKYASGFKLQNTTPAPAAKAQVELQAKRVSQLVTKIELTQNHADNLESIAADQSKYIDKLQTDIGILNGELEALKQSRLYRAVRRIRRII